MVIIKSLIAAALLSGVLPAAFAVELKQDTIDAFDKYISAVEARVAPRYHGGTFLLTDTLPKRSEQLRKGAILVDPGQGSGNAEVKGGMIQDWSGAVFIPGATLPTVLTVVQDYPHHKEIYKPEVADARILSRKGDDFVVRMRVVKSKLFLSDVLNIEHNIQFSSIDPRHVYSRARSTRVAEVVHAGEKAEHELPVGNDRGLLWRLYGYWFFEERDGGVYVECESVTLTRDLPFGTGRLMGPILRGLPAESIRISLEELRQAVLKAEG